MGKEFIGECTIRDRTAAYFLLEENAAFGAEIIWGDERERVADLTSRKEEALALLSRLMRGTVTPVTLRDILEDWLGQ